MSPTFVVQSKNTAMKNVDLYLHFNGNAEKAMNFYKKVFGGEFTMVQRYGDVPGSEKMVAEDKQKLIHIAHTLSLIHI